MKKNLIAFTLFLSIISPSSYLGAGSSQSTPKIVLDQKELSDEEQALTLSQKLFGGIKYDQEHLVRAALEEGIDFPTAQAHGCPAFHLAVMHGRTRIVQYFVQTYPQEALDALLHIKTPMNGVTTHDGSLLDLAIESALSTGDLTILQLALPQVTDITPLCASNTFHRICHAAKALQEAFINGKGTIEGSQKLQALGTMTQYLCNKKTSPIDAVDGHHKTALERANKFNLLIITSHLAKHAQRYPSDNKPKTTNIAPQSKVFRPTPIKPARRSSNTLTNRPKTPGTHGQRSKILHRQSGSSPTQKPTSHIKPQRLSPQPTPTQSNEQEKLECSVCYHPFEEVGELVADPCGHVICPNCVSQLTNRLQNCPTCSTDITSDHKFCPGCSVSLTLCPDCKSPVTKWIQPRRI